ncbi:MAG: sigma-54-dependent Fis family transcriptional regulator [Planctomycetes bacterium]|nr:sigma-54-dependent Fis family transcriptional regulator [Planctomycetota bacterium]
MAEDDPDTARFVRDVLMDEGYEVEWVEDGVQAKDRIKKERFNLLVTDLYMPNLDGPELLGELQAAGTGIPAIVITARPDYRQMAKFIKNGLYDYFPKPLRLDEFLASVRTALVLSSGKAQLERGETGGLPIIGESAQINKVREAIRTVANVDSTVLLLGESGTGKGLVARNIHCLSSRSEKMFLPVNCAAIPESLLESELFGHEKGAFTGAVFRKMGLFQAAHRGTIFLDEIGELHPALQVKLLEVLEGGTIRVVGSTKEVNVDVRIIAATNKDIEAEVSSGRFREDLYYRLNVVPIVLPPLREHSEDIPILLDFLIAEHNLNIGITKEAMKVLRKYSWPGNVRELDNVLVRASILCEGEKVGLDSLPREVKDAKQTAPGASDEGFVYKKAKREFEKKFFTQLLDKANWDVAKAAELGGVSRTYVYDIIKKHNLRSSAQ